MASKEIKDLTGASTPLAGTEEVHIFQSPNSRKVAVSEIASLLSGTSIVTKIDTELTDVLWQNIIRKGPYRYWSIRDLSGESNNQIEVAEFEFRDSSGAKLTGTVSASSAVALTTPAAAYDGNSASHWRSGDDGGASWFSIDLGSGNEDTVYSVMIQARLANVNSPNFDWGLYFSTNGSDWTLGYRANDTGGSYASLEIRTFDVGIAAPLAGMASQDPGSVNIDGGTIDGAVIGGVDPEDGSFDTLVFGTLSDGTNTAGTIQSEASDSTADALLKVGAFGLGSTDLPTVANIDTATIPSGLYQTLGTESGTFPSGVSDIGILQVEVRNSTNSGIFQIYYPSASNFHLVRRYDGSAWTSWRSIYNASNVLGTVSQSSGVPTGALFETGATGNNRYVRTADGLQMCYRNDFSLTFASAAELTGTWTFEAAFSSNPTTFISLPGASGSYGGAISRGDVRQIMATFATTTSADFRAQANGVTFVSGDEINPVSVFAIGRWF